MPPELRPLLVADAEAAGSNLTEVVVSILADRYKVPFEATGRQTDPTPDAAELNLRLPKPLDRKIGHAAYPRSIPQQIREDLCAHYGLTMPTPAKRTRPPRAEAAA